MRLHPDSLPYRKPELGKHYWITDNILPNPLDVTERCFNKSSWTLGSPLRHEAWPGVRASEALLPDELAALEDAVKTQIGVKALRSQQDPVGAITSWDRNGLRSCSSGRQCRGRGALPGILPGKADQRHASLPACPIT